MAHGPTCVATLRASIGAVDPQSPTGRLATSHFLLLVRISINVRREEALGKTPSILQGELTSKRKARIYAQQVLANRTLSEDNGFAARQATSTVKLVNYAKDGRPFVHHLSTRRVMDEDTGVEYFVTESHEDTNGAIRRAMLKCDSPPPCPAQYPLLQSMAVVGVLALALAPGVLPVLGALRAEIVSVSMSLG